jgi:putative N6-adenine-specific DNA methylase
MACVNVFDVPTLCFVAGVPTRIHLGMLRSRRALWVITAPGLESLTAAELGQIGLTSARVDRGGVSLHGSSHDLYAANLHLRTASRVVERIAEFHASSFTELERRVKRIAWQDHIARNTEIEVTATCKKSKLYHSDAVAERVTSWVSERIGAGDARGTQLVLVRIFDDHCTVSLDSSGELLHVRGYRQALAKAPLRESLAAATVLASGWDARAPLIDPLCGSGTIVIEAAMLARRIAPGLARSFAFHHWPDFDADLWRRLVDDARAAVLPTAPAPIQGSDRDAGAIEAASANAARAGVANDIELTTRALSAIEPRAPEASGWIVTNPPYGVRVGDARALRDLYATLGRLVADRYPTYALAMLSANRTLERQLGLPLEEALRTTNGGIPVRVIRSKRPPS